MNLSSETTKKSLELRLLVDVLVDVLVEPFDSTARERERRHAKKMQRERGGGWGVFKTLKRAAKRKFRNRKCGRRKDTASVACSVQALLYLSLCPFLAHSSFLSLSYCASLSCWSRLSRPLSFFSFLFFCRLVIFIHFRFGLQSFPSAFHTNSLSPFSPSLEIHSPPSLHLPPPTSLYPSPSISLSLSPSPSISLCVQDERNIGRLDDTCTETYTLRFRTSHTRSCRFKTMLQREALEMTPSRRDGIEASREARYRREGAVFIRQLGLNLNL